MTDKLTPEEKKLLEEKRKRDEAVKACKQEIEEALKRHNMTLKIYTNPSVQIEPI